MRQQSGTTETCMVVEAKRIYHATQKKHFTFDASWEILYQSCKWDEIRTQTKKPTPLPYPFSNPAIEGEAFQPNNNIKEGQQPTNTSTRPIGTKVAKEKLKNQAIYDVRFDEMAANKSKIVEVLSTMSSRTIERDEQKTIEHEQKAAER
ncbi:hypothetical protein CsSME_00043353 [Camellia sinensis var. sinensis]